MNKPYSYHTFLFPFLWNRELKDLPAFEKMLNMTDGIHWQRVENDPDYAADGEYYAQTQYFKRDVANLLFYPGNENVVRHYRLCSGGHQFSRSADRAARGFYRIVKTDYKGNKAEYQLDIHQIKLSTYCTGVALMTLEAEYWGDKTVNGEKVCSRTAADVNAINEHGRRISLPYVTDGCHPLVADQLEICIDGQSFREDFARTCRDFYNSETELGKKGLSTHFVMKPLRQLLSGTCTFSTDFPEAKEEAEKVFLEHVGDDRMFVCCVVMDPEISEKLSQKDGAGEYLAFTDPEVYKLGFVENDLTCQSDTMLKQILTRCVYDRWINYGTVDVVTHHSLVRLTGEVPHVVNSFLSQYVQMAALAVVQRASIIAMENACVVCGAKDLTELQKLYVLAQKYILLDECTVQEQGVEVFSMLRRELYIHERLESLDKRLKEMCDLATLEHERGEAKLNIWLAVAGCGLTLFSLIEVFLSLYEHLGG